MATHHHLSHEMKELKRLQGLLSASHRYLQLPQASLSITEFLLQQKKQTKKATRKQNKEQDSERTNDLSLSEVHKKDDPKRNPDSDYENQTDEIDEKVDEKSPFDSQNQDSVDQRERESNRRTKMTQIMKLMMRILSEKKKKIIMMRMKLNFKRRASRYFWQVHFLQLSRNFYTRDLKALKKELRWSEFFNKLFISFFISFVKNIIIKWMVETKKKKIEKPTQITMTI